LQRKQKPAKAGFLFLAPVFLVGQNHRETVVCPPLFAPLNGRHWPEQVALQQPKLKGQFYRFVK